MKCFFCQNNNEGDHCSSCADNNEVSAVLTHKKAYSEAVAQTSIVLDYQNRIFTINYFTENDETIISASCNLEGKSKDMTLMFKRVLSLKDANITPQNVRQKLKTYLLFS